MHFSVRRRIICFKVDIKNDLAMLGTMRMESIQRYFHSRHSTDYMFAADYNMPKLKEYFSGQLCEFIEITVRKAEPHMVIKNMLGALSDALSVKTSLNHDFLRQNGVSGRLYRAFSNNYFKLMPGCRYLELGAHDGTGFLAALWGNRLEALAVDDWTGKEESRRMFMNNLMCINAPDSRFGVLDKNMGELFLKALAPRNALFCFRNCAPNPELLNDLLVSTPEAPALLVVDSWNFGQRRRDWLEAIEKSRFETAVCFDVRTSLDDVQYVSVESTRWSNGYFIGLLAPRGGQDVCL
jgi:hypothetical protein